jgi:hypothetical protein
MVEKKKIVKEFKGKEIETEELCILRWMSVKPKEDD